MGKSAPTPPTPPDPTVVASAQTASNQQTAEYQSQLNNMNYSGPQGSVSYSQSTNPNDPQWTENVSLSPSQQGIYNSQVGAEQGALAAANQDIPRVGNALGQSVTPGGVSSWVSTPGLQSSVPASGSIQTSVGPQNYGQALNNEVQTQYGSELQLLNPQLQQQTEQEQAQLTAQGLNPNDAAYQNAMTLLGGQQATTLGQAASQAIGLGDTEQQNLFNQQLGASEFANSAQNQQYGQNLSNAQLFNTAQNQQYQNALASNQFANTAEQQQFQQQAYAQELPINEFASLESGGQVSMPSGASYTPTSVAPTNVENAYGLNAGIAEQNYQAQQQNYNSSLGGLFNLGSAALGLI